MSKKERKTRKKFKELSGKKRQEIPKKTQLWIVGIFVVCFECCRGVGGWVLGIGGPEKYLSVKIVDKAK